MRVDEALATALRAWGNHPCFLEVKTDQEPRATTAQQMLEMIEDRASQLRATGIRAGYFVSLFLNNSADFIISLISLLKVGAIPVLAKMEYRRIELDEIFSNARPEAVIADPTQMPVLRPYLEGKIVLAIQNGSLSRIQSGTEEAPREDPPADLASINYTYRGYGYPLGAMVTHEQYLHGARVLQDGLQGDKGEKMLVVLPMSHIFTLVGCILVPLLFGMSCVIADTMHPRRLFACVRDLRIDHVTSVPEVYALLARVHDPSMDLSSLRVFVSGGSLLTQESYALIKELFSVDVLHGYGLTEFTPVSRNIRGRARGGTVGPICGGVECRIDSPDPQGVGEILIQAPHIGSHYVGRPMESQEAQSGPWFRTGDLGRFDDGHLVFEREKKGTRKINGNMVDLEEV
ncbi:MAG TPA: class I adenylate-forming enzyme family protein, partial [Spirochaetia bacterium]|nr:class I adenylate-forming enzyme family protein [Spirochaetia bacterium]